MEHYSVVVTTTCTLLSSNCHYHVFLLPNATKAVGSTWGIVINLLRDVFLPVTKIGTFKELQKTTKKFNKTLSQTVTFTSKDLDIIPCIAICVEIVKVQYCNLLVWFLAV